MPLDPSMFDTNKTLQDAAAAKSIYENALAKYSSPSTPSSNQNSDSSSSPYSYNSGAGAYTPSSSSGGGNASTAPTARTSGMPDTSGFTQGSDGAMHGVMTNEQINNLKNTSWMGNQYKQDTNGYWSTNPNNPNAERFLSDGRPVGTVGYSNDKTGTNFQGFTTPEQFQAIMGTMGNPQQEEYLIKNMLGSGQIHPYTNPLTGNIASASNPATSISGTGALKPSQMLPGYGYKYEVNNPDFLNMGANDRLRAFQTGNADPYAELNRIKSVYANTTDPSQQANIHNWADQVRQASGISANDPFFGNGNAPTSQGSLNVNVNGNNTSKANVYNGTSYESADQLAKDLGVEYKRDPQTGIPTINGQKIYTYNIDANGNVIVPTRMVANALGYNVNYDSKTGSVNITNTKTDPFARDVSGQGQQLGQPQGGQGSSFNAWGNAWNGMNVQQGQNMPIQPGFTPDWQQYYNQAHAQIDPLYNTQYNSLMGKQASDITGMDQKMNARGIFTSGIAQAAEDDLRAKTTNSVASLFNKQMSDIEKTAQTLYTQAYKQYSDGNTFALKYNQDQINNYMNQQKQLFTQWLGSQKLDLSQQQYALNAWDKMATMQLNQMKAMLPYQYQTANNAANNATSQQNNANNNATSLEKALLPYQSMTVYQQATTQEKQQMDAAINYFKQQGININSAKLMESIRHNQAAESLSSQKLTADIAKNQQNFNEKVRMDDANIAKAQDTATDNMKKVQLEGYRAELSGITSQINNYTTAGKPAPNDLITNYNNIMQKVDSIVGGG